MPIGIVTATGRCAKTIRVRVPGLIWNSHIRKKYPHYTHHLVHDGAEACVEGDCVRILEGYVTSKRKNHIVAEIISPIRTGFERKQLESVEEWVGKREARRADKVLRRGCLKVGVLEAEGAMGVQVEERAQVEERVQGEGEEGEGIFEEEEKGGDDGDEKLVKL